MNKLIKGKVELDLDNRSYCVGDYFLEIHTVIRLHRQITQKELALIIYNQYTLVESFQLYYTIVLHDLSSVSKEFRMDLYEKLKLYFKDLVKEKGIEEDEVEVSFRLLEGIEVLGETRRKDYPLLTGKEKILEAEFRGAKGQAFTLAGSIFHGKIKDVLELELDEDYNRGIFIACLNAVMSYFGLIKGTVHCKNNEPEECACMLTRDFKNHSSRKIAVIGYQPAFIEALVKEGFTIRVLDLNIENIGTDNLGVLIEDGIKHYSDVVQWADIILCTGSTIVNGTIENFVGLDKEVYFYGNTIAGPSKILGLRRICKNAL